MGGQYFKILPEKVLGMWQMTLQHYIAQMNRTGLGKLLLLLWGVVLLSLIASPIIGLLNHQLAGYSAFGFLVSAAALNIAVIISYKVGDSGLQILKTSWLVLGVLMLCFTLYYFDGRPNSDIADFFVWAMLVYSFPSSLLVILLIAGTTYILGSSFPAIVKVSYIYFIISWAAFVAVGYLQWFKIIPIITARLRR